MRRAHGSDGRETAAIFAGGFVGAIARAEVAQALPAAAGQWPWATFLVNIVGALLLGYFTTRLQERLPPSAYRRPLMGTGFCGVPPFQETRDFVKKVLAYYDKFAAMLK